MWPKVSKAQCTLGPPPSPKTAIKMASQWDQELEKDLYSLGFLENLHFCCFDEYYHVF